MKIFGRDLKTAAVTDDEPVVFLPAGHQWAPHLLRDLAARLRDTGDQPGADAVLAHAERVVAWQATHETATTTTEPPAKKAKG